MVFVYGTLKRGYTNHARYLSVAEAHGGARFVGYGTTTERFSLVLRPKHLLPATCGPVMMLEEEGSELGLHVSGEVYEVTSDTKDALNILEGVKEGHYYCKALKVNMLEHNSFPRTCNGTSLMCEAYLYPASPELLALPRRSEYTDADHDLYSPAPTLNQEILRLCRKPAHGLKTPFPCGLKVYCMRLLPNEDVLHALQTFVAERGISAAAIMSAVGSTGKTTLRPAGLPNPRAFEGKFEVVSLSGTVGTGGHHLHMSISDAECRVFGGHVMPGCITRTTLELILGEIQGVEFVRQTDVRTGYDELSVVSSATCAERQTTMADEGPYAMAWPRATPSSGDSLGHRSGKRLREEE